MVCANIRRKISETTINIKKKSIIYAGKVINIDTLVNKIFYNISNKGNNKITELRTILQRESQNS